VSATPRRFVLGGCGCRMRLGMSESTETERRRHGVTARWACMWFRFSDGMEWKREPNGEVFPTPVDTDTGRPVCLYHYQAARRGVQPRCRRRHGPYGWDVRLYTVYVVGNTHVTLTGYRMRTVFSWRVRWDKMSLPMFLEIYVGFIFVLNVP